jgi:hypothetical protein
LERKKNPFRLDYTQYYNSPDSYRINFPQWELKNMWEDTDKCDRCGTEIKEEEFSICPKCKF